MAFKKFKTERMLLASVAVLFLFLFASAFTKEIVGTNVTSAEEGSVSSSNDNEDSQDNEESENDNDENSQDDEDSQDEDYQDEKSEPSVSSAPSVKTTRTTTGLNTSELSEKSSDETSQKSVETAEVSEASEPSEPSEVSQEISEESIKYVEGYGEVVSKEGNVALVKKDEKLFFLIPVEVESKVTLDEQGTVTDSQKSFLNWLLSVFSF